MPDQLTLEVTIDARGTEPGVRQVEVQLDRLGRATARMTGQSSAAYRQMEREINRSFELNQAGFTRMLQRQEREMAAFRDRRVQLGRSAAQSLLAIEQKLQDDIARITDRANARFAQLAARRAQEVVAVQQRYNPTNVAFNAATNRYQTQGGTGVFAPTVASQEAVERTQQAIQAINQKYANLNLSLQTRTHERIDDLNRNAVNRRTKIEEEGQKKLQSIQTGESAATKRHRDQVATLVENSVKSTAAKVQREAEQTALSFQNIFGANFLANIAANAIRSLVSTVTDFIKSSFTYAARTEELGVALYSMARAAGVSEAAIGAQEAVIRRLNITGQETRIVLSRMLQAQLDVTKGTDLAIAAQDLAVVTGDATAETYERLILGITTMQPRILRTAAVYTTLTEIMRENKKETGQTATSLSSHQKQQLLLNEVLNQAARVTGNYDAAMGTAGKQMRTAIRIVDDLKNAFGQQFLGILFGVVKAFNTIGDFFKDHVVLFDIFFALVASGFISFGLAAARTIPIFAGLTSVFKSLFASFGDMYRYIVLSITARNGETASIIRVAQAELAEMGIKKTLNATQAMEIIKKQEKIALDSVELRLKAGLISETVAEAEVRAIAARTVQMQEAATVGLIASESALGATTAVATGGISLLIAGLGLLVTYLISGSDAFGDLDDHLQDTADESRRVVQTLNAQNQELARAIDIVKNHSDLLRENHDLQVQVGAALESIGTTQESLNASSKNLTEAEKANQEVVRETLIVDRARIQISGELADKSKEIVAVLDLQRRANQQIIDSNQRVIASVIQRKIQILLNSSAEVGAALARVKAIEDEQKAILKARETNPEAGKFRGVTGVTPGGPEISDIDRMRELSNEAKKYYAVLEKSGTTSNEANAALDLYARQLAVNEINNRKVNQALADSKIILGDQTKLYEQNGDSIAKNNELVNTSKEVHGLLAEAINRAIGNIQREKEGFDSVTKSIEDFNTAYNNIKLPSLNLEGTIVGIDKLTDQYEKSVAGLRKALVEVDENKVREAFKKGLPEATQEQQDDWAIASQKFKESFIARHKEAADLSVDEFRNMVMRDKDAVNEVNRLVAQATKDQATKLNQSQKDAGEKSLQFSDEFSKQIFNMTGAIIGSTKNTKTEFDKLAEKEKAVKSEAQKLAEEIKHLQVEIAGLAKGGLDVTQQRQRRTLEEIRNLVRSLVDDTAELGIDLGALPFTNPEALRHMDEYVKVLMDIRNAYRELRLSPPKQYPGDEQSARNELRLLEKVKEARDEVRKASEAELDAEASIAALRFSLSIPAVRAEVRAQEMYLKALIDRRDAEQQLTADLMTLARRRLNQIETEAELTKRAFETIAVDTLQKNQESRFEARKAEIERMLIEARDMGNEPLVGELQRRINIEVDRTRNQTPIITLTDTAGKIYSLLLQWDQNVKSGTTGGSRMVTGGRFDPFVAVPEYAHTPQEFQALIGKFVEVLKSRGVTANLVSGGRSYQQQLNIWNKRDPVTGLYKGNPVAPPGTSMHERFMADDFNFSGPLSMEQIGQIAEQLGLTWGGGAAWKARGGKYDPGHFQLGFRTSSAAKRQHAQRRLGSKNSALPPTASWNVSDMPAMIPGDDASLDFRMSAVQGDTLATEARRQLNVEYKETDDRLQSNRAMMKELTVEYSRADVKQKQIDDARAEREVQRMRDFRSTEIQIQLIEDDITNARSKDATYVARIQIEAEKQRRDGVKRVADEIITIEDDLTRKRSNDAEYLRSIQERGYLERRREESELYDQIHLGEDRLVHFGENSALKYQKAWIDAFTDIKQADEDAVTSQIQSLTKLDDATTMHTQQIRANVLKHLESQKTITQAIGDGINTVYDKYLDKASKGIDKLTEKWGYFGSIANSVLKSVTAQLLSRGTRMLLDLFLGPDPAIQSSRQEATGGIWETVKRTITGQGGQTPAAATTQTMVVNAGTVVINAGGGGGGNTSGGSGGLIPLLGGLLGGGSRSGGLGALLGGAGGGFSGGLGGLGSILLGGGGYSYPNAARSGLGGILAGGQGGIGHAGIAGLGSLGGSSAPGFLSGLAGMLPLAGVGIGSALGGGSRLGSILGGIGGGLAGLSGLAALAPSLLPALLAGVAIPGLIFVAPLIIGAVLLARNAARRRDEKSRNQSMIDSLASLDDIISQVKADKIDGTEALSQAASVRASYMQMAQGLKDKKTRNIAIKDVYRLDLKIDQIKAEAAKQTQRQEFVTKFVPTYAGGTNWVPGNFGMESVIKARPGEGLIYPFGQGGGIVPGHDRGYDSVMMSVPAGTRVLTRNQVQNSVSMMAGGVAMPVVPSKQPSTAGRPIVVVVVADEKAAADIGRQIPDSIYAGKIRTNISKTRGSGLVGDIASELSTM